MSSKKKTIKELRLVNKDLYKTLEASEADLAEAEEENERLRESIMILLSEAGLEIEANDGLEFPVEIMAVPDGIFPL
jgi:hypothetical protein